MTSIRARTYAELTEYVYLVSSECTNSGSYVSETVSVAEDDDGEWVRQYDLVCADCGLEWHFTATVDPEPEETDPTTRHYGYGPEPSRLIDAGQWYLLFARWLAVARELQDRQEPDGSIEPLDLQRMIGGFDRARAALDEVLKFIPAGQDRVPESAVWTDQGRWAYEEEPAQFVRDQLDKLHEQMMTLHGFYDEQYQRMNGESP